LVTTFFCEFRREIGLPNPAVQFGFTLSHGESLDYLQGICAMLNQLISQFSVTYQPLSIAVLRKVECAAGL
jgi:hypothetical protein